MLAALGIAILGASAALAQPARQPSREAPNARTPYYLWAVKDLPDRVAQTLAHSGLPIWHRVSQAGGERFDSIPEAVCGKQSPEMTRFLLRQAMLINYVDDPGLVIAENTSIAIPFCLKLGPPERVPVARGDTVDTVLVRHTGSSSSDKRKELCEANWRECDRSSLARVDKRLADVDSVLLPYTSNSRIFSPKTQFQFSLTTFLKEVQAKSWPVAQLLQSAKPVPPEVSARPSPNDYEWVKFQTATQAECPTGKSTTPFDFEELKSRLNVEREIMRVVKDSHATIGIVDTGVYDVQKFFKSTFFVVKDKWKRDLECGDIKDCGTASYYHDVYGINFNGHTGVFPDETIKYYKDTDDNTHGTEMATLILGGPKFIESVIGVPPVRLKVVNFALKCNSTSVCKPTVDWSNLPPALQYLIQEKSEIINLSLNMNAKNPNGSQQAVTNLIRSKTETLFVVAAGNREDASNNDDDNEITFPANIGGIFQPNVITIGAYGSDLKLYHGSKYSNQMVDLLGPGCGLQTWSFGKKANSGQPNDDPRVPWSVSGTSAAAAVTSFVAGLARYLGVPVGELKKRLIQSVDYDANLNDMAVTSGRLNAIKAISISHDVIELKNSMLFVDYIKEAKSNISTFCGDPNNRIYITNHLDTLVKVIPNKEQKDKIEYWFWENSENGNNLKKKSCGQENKSKSIGYIKEGGVKKEGPLLSEIKDIVFKAIY